MFITINVCRHTPETTLSCRLTIHKNFLRVEYPQVPEKLPDDTWKVTQWDRWVWVHHVSCRRTCLLWQDLRRSCQRILYFLPTTTRLTSLWQRWQLFWTEISIFLLLFVVWQNCPNQDIFVKGLLVAGGFIVQGKDENELATGGETRHNHHHKHHHQEHHSNHDHDQVKQAGRSFVFFSRSSREKADLLRALTDG